MDASDLQAKIILLDLVERYRVMETYVNAHQLLIHELIRLSPTDTTQQLLSLLRTNIHNNPSSSDVYSCAAEIVEAVQGGTQPKSMKDILKIIPGGKKTDCDALS